MSKSLRVKHFVAPALLTLAAMGLGTGCSSAKNALSGNCGASLTARVNVLDAAIANLEDINVKVSASVAHACYQIAHDLGSTNSGIADATGTGSDAVSSSQVTTNCDEASAQLTAAFQAAGTGAVTVSVIAPSCQIDASTQLNCQGQCNVSAGCSAPDITAECDSGHLSGTCTGNCTGKCTAELTAAASCTGTCNGTCSGNCTGTASSGTGTATTANGQCNGTCDGQCQGQCTADVSGGASCSGSCTGSCDVTMTAPSCDVALKAPSCDAAANCNASCNSSASLNATCTKPTVAVTVSGSANANLKSTLETNLPALVQVAAQFKLAAQAVLDIASQAASLGADFER